MALYKRIECGFGASSPQEKSMKAPFTNDVELMGALVGDGSATLDGRRLLTEEEKQKMSSIIHSMVYWVGVLVPEYELLDEHKVELRDTVYRLVTKDNLNDEDKAKIDALIISLRQREHDLERQFAHDAMTVQAGKALVEEIRGLLKAIDQLRSAESEDVADLRKRDVMYRVEDARRWHKFIQDIKPPK